MINYKTALLAISGIVTGIVSKVLGVFGPEIGLLMTLMIADYITGLAVAIFWKKSPKTKCGRLESRQSLKGLIRKGTMLLFVCVGWFLDYVFHTDFVASLTIYSFIANELISLIENATLMNVPIPKIITGRLAIIKKLSESEVEENNVTKEVNDNVQT